jgi:hypothetical protein
MVDELAGMSSRSDQKSSRSFGRARIHRYPMSSLDESTVELAALEWFGELGYAVGHGPQLAPGEPAAERDAFSEVVLVGRVREALRQLNSGIPKSRTLATLRDPATTGLPQLLSGELSVAGASGNPATRS